MRQGELAVAGLIASKAVATCEIIQGVSGFRARRLPTEEPLAPWRPTKIQACRDILATYGPSAYVIDRTGAEPRADWQLFDNLT
jgi:hypothetical protein